jgi:hypothetical protein
MSDDLARLIAHRCPEISAADLASLTTPDDTLPAAAKLLDVIEALGQRLGQIEAMERQESIGVDHHHAPVLISSPGRIARPDGAFAWLQRAVLAPA